MTHVMSPAQYRATSRKARKSKYRSMRTVVDGVAFHSKKESLRWVELRLLERAGEISHLERQPEFPLLTHRAGEYIEVCRYRADFRYRRGEQVVVEDVKSKGTDTPMSKLKRKWLKAQTGIDVVIL